MTSKSAGPAAIASLDYAHQVFIEMDTELTRLRELTADAVEQPEDDAVLQPLLDLTQNMHSTFCLIECHGAELLTAELLSLFQAMRADRINTEINTAPVLILASEKLTEYVEYLRRGGQDVPLALLSLVNNMRACHSASLLSEALIVSPHFQIPDVVFSDKIDTESTAAFFAVAASIRVPLMHGLVGWLREPDERNSDRLARFFTTLGDASPAAELRDLWYSSKAVTLSLADGGLESSVAIKVLMGQLERYLQKLGQQSELHSGIEFPSNLFKNLLYYIALSESEDESVAALKQQYRLRELLPPKASLDVARSALGGPGARLSDSICDSLKHELTEIKSALEATAAIDSILVKNALYRLQQVSYTLLLLGLHHARRLNDSAIARLELCAADKSTADMLTVASDILQVEAAVEEYLHRSGRPTVYADKFDAPSPEPEKISAHQRQQVIDQCLREAVNSLRTVQKSVVVALSDQHQLPSVKDSAAILDNVSSALQILPLPEIKPLLDGAAVYLRCVAEGSSALNEQEQLWFADLIVCCEFYLDSSLQQQPAASDLLQHADFALDGLQRIIDEHDATMVLDSSARTANSTQLQHKVDAIYMPPGSSDVTTRVSDEVADTVATGMMTIFIEEALEILNAINVQLSAWQTHSDDLALEKIKRYYHTLKGSGRMSGAIALSEFAAVNEEFVERLLLNGIEERRTARNLLEESSGVLPQLINQLSDDSYALNEMSTRQSSASDNDEINGLQSLVERIQKTALTTAVHSEQVPARDAQDTASSTAVFTDAALEQTRHLVENDLDQSATLNFDNTLLRVFYAECCTHIAELRELLGVSANRNKSSLPTMEMQRSLHTLRGSAQTAGVSSVVNLIHPLEEITNEKLALGQSFDQQENKFASESVEVLGLLVDALADGQELPDRVKPLQSELTQYVRDYKRLSDRKSGASDLQDLFIDEATDLLGRVGCLLESLQESAVQLTSLGSLRAELHSLKGSAHVANFTAIADLTHALEGAIERWVDDLPLSSTRSVLLQDVIDAITMNLEQARTGGSLGQFDWLINELESDRVLQVEDTHSLLDDVTQVIGAPYTHPASKIAQQPESVHGLMPTEAIGEDAIIAPIVNSAEQIRLDAAAVTKLSELSTEVSIQHARVNQYFHDLRDTLLDMDKTTDRLRHKLRELQRTSDVKIPQIQGRTYAVNENDATTQFDALELEHFTQMSDDSRQLAEILADFDVIRSNLHARLRESEESLSLTARLGSDIQQSLVRSRLVRFNQHSHRLSSLVRQTAATLNKQVEWELIGGERSIDRGIHKSLAIPLEHLIRNAIAHGIEAPEERLVAGKSATGRVVLTVALDGNYLVVAVADDGAGVDMEAVRDSVEHDQPGDLSDQELLLRLFQSGFTTADSLSQLAGRGIGLDVVERSVTALDGSVLVNTSKGSGTTVTLRIPQRVSIHQVVLVTVDEMTFGIPVDSVHTVQSVETDDDLTFDGENYRCGKLIDLLELPNSGAGGANRQPAQAILVQSAGCRFALRVNDVLGYRELLASPLGRQMGSLKTYTGGSILADGRCVMILDLNLLLPRQQRLQKSQQSNRSVHPRLTTPDILIVDDSVTMRTYAEKLLTGQGYTSIFARDGVDALERLEEVVPRLILLDLEMPRMNGFEVLAKLREQPSYAQVPVVIISSRSSTKHRQQADDLGASGYLVKPYREEELMRLIERLAQTTADDT